MNIKIDSTSKTINPVLYKKKFQTKVEILKYLDSISNKLSIQGYINNYYNINNDSNDERVINASFKLFSKIENVQIYYKNEFLDFSKFKTPIKIITPNYIELSTENTTLLLNEIKNYFENLGYLFSKATLTNLILINTRLKANLTITQSSKRKIDKITIKGYSEVSERYLHKILAINKKNIFNNDALKNIENTLNSVPFFNKKKQPEILFTKDSTLLYLYLEKKSNNNINGIISFSTDENNKLILNGDLDLHLSNIFNGGEAFDFTWKSYNNNSSLQTNLKLPIFLATNISFKGNFNIIKQDTLYTTSQGNLNIIYDINNSHTLGIITDFENSNLNSITSTENYNNYKKKGIGITYTHTSLLNKGKTKINIATSYIIGKKNNSIKQESISFQIENTHKLNFRSNINFKLKGQLLNTSKVLSNELYQIGGINSLRGFDKFSVYASKYALSNFEYHYNLNKKKYIYSITDFAMINNMQNSTKNSLLGIGIGYKFETNRSSINFSYVTGLVINTNKKNQNKKIYLNISHFF